MHVADAKYSHLKKLDKASENLKLFKADLLNYDSLHRAIEGCDGVFHVASPVPSGSVPNPEASVSNYSLILVLAIANMLVSKKKKIANMLNRNLPKLFHQSYGQLHI